MSYGDVYLENIEVPKEAFEKAKKDYDWQQETAPGVYRMLWYANEEDKRPAFFFDVGEKEGFKHGLAVNYADKRMSKINKILKEKTGLGWKDYLLEEINKNPVLAAAEHAVIYDWQTIAVYLWTSKEEDVPVLLGEASKAIRKLVAESESRLNDELQGALDEGDLEGYTEQFVEVIGEGSKKEIELAFAGAKTLLETELDPELLAALAVATIKIGTKPLQAFAKDFELSGKIADQDDDFNNSFIIALQQFYQDAMYAGDDWKASKELVKRYYDNINEVMKVCGYKVNKMAIMTIIFLFYNDVIEGIGFDSYTDDEDYRDEEWPYTDTDLSFWEKFDPDTITGLKTGKGGYNPEGDGYDEDDDDDDEGYDDDDDEIPGFKKYLEYEDDKSHKFWSIEVEGDSFTVQYGKVGTDGQTQTKEFDSGEAAEKEAQKLCNSKIKKGYKEATSKETDTDKETLGEMLTSIRDQVVGATEEDYEEYNWYLNVIDLDEALEDLIDDEEIMTLEDAFAVQAVKYPEFFPLLREIVKGITEINIKHREPLNIDSEWSAGTFFATRLALASKEADDIRLFARHLGERDLDHEADPYDGFGILEIFEELGYTDATMPVVMGALFANSQHRGNFLGDDELTAYLNKGDNLNKFLKTLAEWADKYRDISSVEDAFELVLSDIFDVDDEEAAKKFHKIRKERVPVKEDFLDDDD